MKKAVAIILAAVSLLTVSLLSGCFLNTSSSTYEDGFFVCFGQRNSQGVAIIGLTELGHEQKVIVMPETIGGGVNIEYLIRVHSAPTLPIGEKIILSRKSILNINSAGEQASIFMIINQWRDLRI